MGELGFEPVFVKNSLKTRYDSYILPWYLDDFFQKTLFINYSVGGLGFELIFAKNSLNDRGMILTYCHGILTTFYRTILSKNTFSSTIQWGIRVRPYFRENVVKLNEV